MIKHLRYNIPLLLFLVFSYSGIAQSINLSKNRLSPTFFEYSNNDDYYLVNILPENCEAITTPSNTRLYNPNNCFFEFNANNNGGVILDFDFRITIGGGISLFLEEDGHYTEIYYSDFNTDLLQVKFFDESISNKKVIVQLWVLPIESAFLAHLKINQFAGYGNIKVPTIDISTYTPQQLVQDILISGCVEAQNVTYSGSLQSIGYFDNGIPGLSFANGIVMSTGRVTNVEGPNDTGSEGTNLHQSGDSDLTGIVGMQTHDAAVLEFDFIPASNVVSFEYVFGSEEYEEFVGQGFNDIFGFFVSGGPEAFSNINIARIPVVGSPVSINNVNQTTNSAYYINNDGGLHIQFDGMTVTLTAFLNVTQCETYHMKLAVADVGDGIYDSGVFLKAGSFSSGASVELQNYDTWGLENTVYEGCTNQIVFARSDASNLTNPMPVVITVGGTATNGTDYTTINNNYTIPAGQESITVNLNAVADGITEGAETVIINVFNGCPCSVQTASDTITILDQIIFTPTLTNNGPKCQGESVLLSLNLVPLPDTVRIEWSNGVIGPSQIIVSPSATTTYTATIFYPCSSQTISTTVTVKPAPVATASNDGPYCVGDPIHLFSTGGGTYRWRGPSSYLTLQQNPTINNAQLNNGGTYRVTVTGANGCTAVASTYVAVYPLPNLVLNANTPFCEGDPISFVIDTFPDYFYWGPNSWNSVDSFPIIPNSAEIHEGWYYTIVTDTNACRAIDSVFIEVNPSPVANGWSNSPICEGGTIQLFSSGGPSYSWTGPAGFTSTDQNTTINNATPANSGNYTITVINIFNCPDSFTVNYVVTPAPDAGFTNPSPLCFTSADLTLVPVIAGGTWSGTGIMNPATGLFSPSTAGIGSHTVDYTVTVNGCVGTHSEIIVIDTLPIISIDPAGPFCVLNSPVNLSTTTPGGIWSGTGITDAANGTFDPAIAGAGNHTITYTLVNGGCSDSDNISILVFAIADATITASGPFCETGPSVTLTAVTPGGTWSGIGITDPITGTFDPAVAGIGTYTITYDVSIGSCIDTDTENFVVDFNPNTTISPAGPFCANNSAVNLTAATAGGTWSGTGITNAVLGTFNPTTAGSGNHIITYQIINGGCTSTDTETIHVDANVNATITAAGPFCVTGASVTLTSVSLGGIWSGTGITNPATGTFDPAIAGVGIHTITYSVTNGMCSDTDTENFVVSFYPNSTITPAGPFCANNSAVNLTAATGGGTWSGTGITNAVLGTFNPTTAGSGNHIITYQIINGGCTSTDTETIHVDANVNATITAAGPFCETGLSVILAAATPGGTWSGTGITDPIFGIFNPAIAGVGIHTITYTVTNGTCSDTDTENIIVSLFTTANINSAGPFCESNSAVNLTAVTGGGTWSGTGITNAALGTFNPIISGAGNFIITYQIINGGCTSTDTETIHVDASVNATITPAGPYCQTGLSVILSAVTPGGTWSGTGITDPIIGIFNPAIAGVGTHTITYTVTNGTCSDTDTENIVVSLFTSATITPAGPFCESGAPINLAAATVGGVWSGTGITNAALGTFDPSVAGVGDFLITYQIINGGCSNSDTENIHVDAAVDATITASGPFCVTNGAVNLTAVDAGGTWSGTGITNAALGTFNPATAGVGIHTITYTISNGSCLDTDTENIVVSSFPNSTINPAGPFCETGLPVNLTSVTGGGTWSGTGITNAATGTFNPVVAGAGDFLITYQIINGGCTSSDTETIHVDISVDATITAAGPFCETNPAVNLTAVDAGGIWSGTGITNAVNGTFDPAVANPGVHTITYTVTNGACSDTDTELLTVYLYPNSDWFIIGPFCETDAAVNILPVTSGGTFSGTGITNAATGTFNPATAGSGTHNITYTIVNGACTSVTTKPVLVYSSVDATISAAGPFCQTNPAVNLIAADLGGTWAGTGITNPATGSFDPAVAGPGVHNITYTISNGNCSDSDNELILVYLNPNADFVDAGPFCENGAAVNLVSVNPGGTWSGTGITNAALGTFNPAVAGPGVHNISYTIINVACTAVVTKPITVNDAVDATITLAGPFCQNQAATNLVAADPGGTWSGTGITNPATGLFNPAIAGPGIHAITYSIVNGACSDNDIANIIVNIYPNSTINAVGPLCQSAATINLTAASGGGTWSGTGITNAALGTFNPSVAGSGNHTITYTIVNGACTSISTTVIHVDASVNATITPVAPVCVFNAAFNLTAVSLGGVWSGTGITNAGLGTFDPTIAGPGIHTITYTVSNGTCLSTDTENINVSASPNPTIFAVGPFCADAAALNLTAVTAGGTWSGTGITNALLGTFNPGVANGGDHIITYTVSLGACTNSDTETIHVDADVDATITPAGPFCQFDPSLNLTAVSPSGTWSGTGITNTSTGTFDPSVAGVGIHNITYNIVNGLCSDSDNINITINIAPDGTINDPGIFCSADPAVNLTSVTPGGTWSGSGITNAALGTFNPAVAIDGENIVTYTISNGFCTTIASISIFVYFNVVDATISSTGPYCIDAGIITLNAATPGGTWSGTGITNAATGSFDPGVAGPGNHLITYNVGSVACFDTDTQLIHVDDSLSATITHVAPVCQSASAFNFVAATAGGTWSGIGITNAALGTFNPVIAGVGSYIITYTISQGSCTNTDSFTIQVDAAVNATISPAGPFCNNQPIQNLTAVSPGGTWSGTGIVNTVTGLFHPGVAGGGNHIITYNVSNGACSAMDTETIHVDVFPNTAISPVGPFCETAAALNLNAASIGGTWSGNGITDPVAGTFNPAVAGGGNHTITYTITNGTCLSTSNRVIQVDDFYDATITPAGPFCNTQPAQNLVAASTGGTWSGTGITDVIAGTFHPGISGPGDFVITYSTSNGLCSDIDNISIHVDEFFDATITPAGPFCENALAVILTAANPGGLWSGTGVIVPGTGSFNPATAGAGDHIITYAINNGACSSSDTETIHIDALLNATITPAGPFCQNAAAVNLTAATASGSWSGTGITNAAIGTFNPAVAGAGNHIVTYQLINGMCTSSDTETIHVDIFPNTTLASYGPYCETAAAVNLVEPSIGGTWTGNGITNAATGIFNPFVAGDGSHLITYSIVNGACTSVGTTNIQVDSAVNATITPAGPFCNNDPSVFLTAANLGGTWSGTGIVSAATGLFNPVVAGAGTHNIQYTVTNGLCTDTDIIPIVVEQAPNTTIITTGPFCENAGNQVFTAVDAGGDWTGDGIDITGNFDPALAGLGTHTITYTISTGACLSSSQIDILVDEFFDASITSNGPFCFMDDPIQLNATNLGGTWSGTGVDAAGLFSPDIAGVGNHNITYTIVNGACTDSDSRIFVVNDNPDATITDILPICISIPPFDFVSATSGGTWSGTGITDALTGTFDPRASGDGTFTIYYTVTVLGCSSIDSTSITVNPLPVVTITGLDADYCLNEAVVVLTLSPLGGILTGNGISGTTFTPSLAGPGNHHIVYSFSDINTCSDSATFDLVVYDLPVVSISGIDPYYCLLDAAVNPVLLPAGGVFEGTGVLGYSFDPQLAGPGNYDLIYHFTDFNSCTDTARVNTTVLDSPDVEFDFAEPLCYSFSDASITTTVSGGLAPYTYLWGDVAGSTTPGLNNISAGMYYLTVTDANLCTKIDSIEVTQPEELIVQITNQINAGCYGYSDGSALAETTGGTPDYTYLWDDTAGTVTELVENLAIGDYSVVVTDLNACTATAAITITQPDTLSLNFINIENVACYSESNGSIGVEVFGGTLDYSAEWNDSESTIGFSVSNLAVGFYAVTITDANNCQISDSLEITQPDPIYYLADVSDVICSEQTGSISIATFGGVAPYHYLWSTGETIPIISNKPAGTYLLTITDSNDCTLLTSIVIGTTGINHAEITQTAFNLCFKDELASLFAHSDNGASVGTYLWSNFATDSVISNLGAGQYSVTITDDWGCVGIDTIIVTEPDELSLSITSVNIKCRGDLSGHASINVTGGTTPYFPLWQNGDQTLFSNTLPAGQIWVTVTDVNGCNDSISTIITQPATTLSLDVNVSQITCYGASDGSINSFAIDGTPPYFYNWNLHGLYLTDPTIRNLDIGLYSLTITDNNNCAVDTSITIVQPNPLSALFVTGNPSCDGNHDGYIQMAGIGGTLPYSYLYLNDIPVSYIIDSLYEGDYFIIIKDSNNCDFTAGPITLVDNDIDCLHYPVAFSPNGDGYNDVWFIENINLYPKSVVQIYNRWGQLLYEEKGIDGFWDGTYNGKPVPTGAYIYMIILNNDEKTRTGTLTVIR